LDKADLYNQMADRKFKPKDLEPYAGDNGRVNKAFALYKSGKLKSGGTHVDVGGGIGDLGFALRQERLFEKTLTVDISAKNLQAASKKGNFVMLADVDKSGFSSNVSDPDNFGGPPEWTNDSFGMNSNNRIDAISALDFIEHIIDPGSFAYHCAYMLKSGGEVFINTPNIQYWRHIEKLIFDGRFPHTSGDREVYHGGHLAFFTYLDLCEIFGNAGFEKFEQIKDVEGYCNPSSLFIGNILKPQNQQQYTEMCMRMGNPNLLFKATKP